MKVKLLNVKGLMLPIVVEAIDVFVGFDVMGHELIKQGADPTHFNENFTYFFKLSEVEAMRCKAIRQGDQMQCVCGLAWDVDDTDLPECIV